MAREPGGGLSSNAEQNRGPYQLKACAVIFILLLDLAVSATSDFNDMPQLDNWYPLLVLGIHFLLQILNLLVLFLLFAGTYLFQVGLIGELMREFRQALIVAPVYLVVFLAYALHKGLLILRDNVSQGALWNDSGFFALSILQKLLSVVYGVVMLGAVLRLGEVVWYSKGPWMHRFRDRAVRDADDDDDDALGLGGV